MPIDLNDKAALITAAKTAPMPIAFLLGSALSVDVGGGVPGVGPMLELVRDEISAKAPSELTRYESHLTGKSGADAYQAAMRWLQSNMTQEAVNRVISAAVLRARRVGAPLPFTGDGIADDWHLTRGVLHVAELVTRFQERFLGPILTTNFDPLLLLAVEAAGGRANLRVIDSDGNVGRKVEQRPGVIDVVHLHGYWRDADTLHTPTQLTGARPKLKASLQTLLRQRTLIVAAYGGWDDVFTAALAELLNDDDTRLSVLWCFYESDPVIVAARYQRLLDRVAPAVTRGRFLAYGGIDCHSIFAEMGGFPAAVAAAPAATSPLAGWEQITPTYLTSLPPLQPEEVVRYFDGAVPTWRHSVSDAIPRRRVVSEIGQRLGKLHSTKGGCSLQLIRAAGGEGKSTVLLQAAADVARNGWTVLWRPSPRVGIAPEHVLSLDSDRHWLLIADDAENLIRDLAESARILHEAGRTDVHFLLAARDTDWRFARGDNQSWGLWLKHEPDIVLRGIERADAAAVVDAWRKFGAEGLREMSSFANRDEQVAALENAVKDAARARHDGSLFGGLLAVRFGQEGLRAHVRTFLNKLKEEPIQGGDTLFEALLYVAACHGVGIPGINANVLADLVSVPRDWVYSRVVRPLGEEAVAVHSAGHVFTRHSMVAAAILVEAELSLGIDLSEVWANLVQQTVLATRSILVGPQTFRSIVHAGPKLQRALPQQLPENRRKAIAIAAAQADMLAEPDRLVAITDLGKTYRLAGEYAAACRVFRDNLIDVSNKVDFEVVRGYWYEWGICEGLAGNTVGHRAAGAWLQGFSICDHLNPTPITYDQAKLSCAGLGVAFGKMAEPRANCPYAKGRRAVAYLGRLSSPDPKTMGYYDRYDRESDRMKTPRPVNVAEAIAWLTTGVAEAGRQLQDPFLSELAEPDQISFKHLQTILSRAADA